MTKPRRTRREWLPEDLATLVRLYPVTPAYVLADQLKRSIRCIYVKAQSLGLDKEVWIRRGTPSPWLRKYDINESAFKDLSSETAYVMGFIAADGCLTSGAPEVTIANNDPDILARIGTALRSTYPIRRRHRKNGLKDWYALVFQSRTIYESLIARGITPRKSHTLQMPDVPDGLFFHFLRGYFDGDGTVTLKNGTLRMNFTCGSCDMLRQVSERITAQLKIPYKHFTNHSSAKCAFVLTYHGPTALAIADAMYRDAGDLCLARKRERFENYRANRKRIFSRSAP